MTKLTLLDVLSAASANSLADINTAALSDLFKISKDAEKSLEDEKQPLKNYTNASGAENIRKLWLTLISERIFKEDHPIMKSANKYTNDPKTLIMNKDKHYKSAVFNMLSNFGLGSATKPGAGYNGRDNTRVGNASQAPDPKPSVNHGTTTSDASRIIQDSLDKKQRKANKEKKEKASASGSAISEEDMKNKAKALQDQISAIIANEMDDWKTKFNDLKEDFDKAQGEIGELTTKASDALKAADQNTRIINGFEDKLTNYQTDTDNLKDNMDEANRRIANLTNEIHSLTVAPFDPEFNEFTIMQFYTLNKNCRAEYRKAVNLMRANGLINLDINPDLNAIYLTIDDDRPNDSVANFKQIEDKLATDGTGKFNVDNRVKIKKAKVIKKKNNKFAVVLQINAVASVRGGIVERLIKDRHNNIGHFGLKQEIPEHYNIDTFLTWLKFKVTDPITGAKVIYGFDTNRLGFYVIYINNFEENGYDGVEVNKVTGRVLKPKDKCSIIRPHCPIQFAKLQKKYFTIDNLLKLTKPDEYFCYGGHILKVPGSDSFGLKEAEKKEEEKQDESSSDSESSSSD